MTKTFSININKVVVLDRVSHNNWKDFWDVDCRLESIRKNETQVIKTSRNVFSYGVSKYKENAADAISLNVYAVLE